MALALAAWAASVPPGGRPLSAGGGCAAVLKHDSWAGLTTESGPPKPSWGRETQTAATVTATRVTETVTATATVMATVTATVTMDPGAA